MINFSKPPHPFKIGDRCHLKETPLLPQTQGTISQASKDGSPGYKVHWDDGDWGLQSTIALERIQFRPIRIPQFVWEKIPRDYRSYYTCTPNLKGYRNALFYDGGTTLVPVVVVQSPITFDLGQSRWIGSQSQSIGEDKFLILDHAHTGKKEEEWVVIEIDAEKCSTPLKQTYFEDWKESYRFFQKHPQV